jgi:hypothetical protein
VVTLTCRREVLDVCERTLIRRTLEPQWPGRHRDRIIDRNHRGRSRARFSGRTPNGESHRSIRPAVQLSPKPLPYRVSVKRFAEQLAVRRVQPSKVES